MANLRTHCNGPKTTLTALIGDLGHYYYALKYHQTLEKVFQRSWLNDGSTLDFDYTTIHRHKAAIAKALTYYIKGLVVNYEGFDAHKVTDLLRAEDQKARKAALQTLKEKYSRVKECCYADLICLENHQ